MGGGGEGGSDGARAEELIDTVLTCEGNIKDPQLPIKISRLIHHLQIITDCKNSDWVVRKVEPWNSVRVTFSIPKEAAGRLYQLAQAGDAALRQLGILSVQVDGDQIVSLKVACANNETADIIIRTDAVAGPSGEHSSNSSTNQSMGVAGMLPIFRQQHHQPHPVPQFRSPSASITTEVFTPAGRAITQQKTQGQQGFAYVGVPSNPSVHIRHAQPSSVLAAGGTSQPSSIVQRPVFPANPPPPYPNQELRQTAKVNNPQQVASASQVGGQHYVTTPSNGVIAPSPSVVQHPPQVSSLVQSVTSGYRVSGNQINSVSSTPNRGQVRGQLNMVKNSPLLVGLLQQPEQSVGQRNNKNVALNPSLSSLPNSLPIENGPLSHVISNTTNVATSANSGNSIISRTREVHTSQQIFSGGSVITNSMPSHSNSRPVGVASATQNTTPGQFISAPTRLQAPDDQRRVLVASSASGSMYAKSSVMQSNLPVPDGATKKEEQKETSSIQSVSCKKKESQYLINPNTGLLEPRPSTDSSDSEPEVRSESPDNFLSNTFHSIDKTDLNSVPRKGVDHLDTQASIASVGNLDKKGTVPDNVNNTQDKELSSMTWENAAVCPSPGEKIKLRLKLGKEQVAQTTFVGNANMKFDRKEGQSNVAVHSNTINEPRVPKLHIKLHSSQPVIIKSVEETEDLSHVGLQDLPSSKEDKSTKRKFSKNKLKNSELDMDPFKSKSTKLKLNKEHYTSEDEEISSLNLKVLDKKHKGDSDLEDNTLGKYKDLPDGRVKVSRMSEITKSSKAENKLRTRLKKTSMRKVGDLNSVGEIASHKIMENLPPSITKVAAIHTQQPHRNPNSLSPIPFSSISTSLLSGTSISASYSTATTSEAPPAHLTNTPTGDHFKAELEKRGSEIIPKTDIKVNAENPSSSSDILMTKLRMNNPGLKNLVNGDVTHSEKLTINQMRFKRTGPLSAQSEFPAATKLTIKRKSSEETHTLKSLKKEGLSSVPTFLTSSVLINKVSDNTSLANVTPPMHQTDTISDKLLKKVDGMKVPHRTDITSLKSNSDITIHSVTKSDVLGLPKLSDFDRRADLTLKAKHPDVTKVGRVTCVDVMDRKALEEALKSSRNSSKKNDFSFSRSTSSMVDRLRRWNSIDSSNSVPLSSQARLQASDSTNINSPTSIKGELKERGESDRETSLSSFQTAFAITEAQKSKSDVSHASLAENDVNSSSNCDNSSNEFLEKQNPFKTDSNEEKIKDKEDVGTGTLDPESASEVLEPSDKSSSNTPHSSDIKSEINEPDSNELGAKSKCEQGKLGDLGSSISSLKSEMESPEGTPKGEHGNGQGGEDSGIESMDALSEKSPNHSDQSPNRREDKECDMFTDKCKPSKNAPLIKNLKIEGKESSDKSLIKEEQLTKEDLSDSSLNVKPDNDDRITDKALLDVDPSYPRQEFIGREYEKTHLQEDNTSDLSTEVVANAELNKNAIRTTSVAEDEANVANKIPETICDHKVQLPSISHDSLTSIEEKSSNRDQSSGNKNVKQVVGIADSSKVSCNIASKESIAPSHAKVVTQTADISGDKSQNCSSSTIISSLYSSISLTTSSLTVSSPKTSFVTSHSSCTQTSASQISCSISSTKTSSLPFNANFKPSLLAITLTRPSLVNTNVSSVVNASTSSKSEAVHSALVSISNTSSNCKFVPSVDVQNSNSNVHTNSSACSASNSNCNNSKSMSLCSSVSTISTSATPTMIILSSTTSSPTTVISTPPNNTKVVTLKPGLAHANNSINPPMGKTFRLVALPGINSMAPSSSPVKGQLVTLKPVLAPNSASIYKGSALLQTVSAVKFDEPSSSILKACLTSGNTSNEPVTTSKCLESPVSEGHSEDLDFVGFSSPPEKSKVVDSSQPVSNVVKSEIVSKGGEDPTPLRVNPPLYTYGNRERKKDVESDAEEKDKEELKEEKIDATITSTASGTVSMNPNLFETKEPTDEEVENLTKESLNEDTTHPKINKDKKLNALTIEIPSIEPLPDEKRLTRSTRQSARLASPKVNSPACTEDKKSPANISTMGRPSPVGVNPPLRSSVSPALKGNKRRRHESESSNASNISEDQVEPSSKSLKRKTTADKTSNEAKEELVKNKLIKRDVDHVEKENDAESSDEEVLLEEEMSSKKTGPESSFAQQDPEDESRPSSRSGRSAKSGTRTRERNALTPVESGVPVRASTPTRRTPRQNRTGVSSGTSPSPLGLQANSDKAESKDSKPLESPPVDGDDAPFKELAEKKSQDKKGPSSVPVKESIGKGAQKIKKDGEADIEVTSGRRKTRSTTNTTSNTEDSKRRRLSKEK